MAANRCPSREELTPADVVRTRGESPLFAEQDFGRPGDRFVECPQVAVPSHGARDFDGGFRDPRTRGLGIEELANGRKADRADRAPREVAYRRTHAAHAEHGLLSVDRVASPTGLLQIVEQSVAGGSPALSTIIAADSSSSAASSALPMLVQ